MQIWRLVAHHEESEKALQIMKERGRIAIGWSAIGDLNTLSPRSYKEISSRLREVSPNATNDRMAGSSLWNLYTEVKVGDQVIVTAEKKRRCVFEITGNYYFDEEKPILGYSHQRPVALTEINANDLWEATGSSFAVGENARWTLSKCKETKIAEETVYSEGKRYSINSTAVERDTTARKKCLEHFGYSCNVCSFNFEEIYGDIGKEYIHVHHRVDLAYTDGQHFVDPVKDLIPLCPNCHAMIHTERPSMSLEKLKSVYDKKHT